MDQHTHKQLDSADSGTVTKYGTIPAGVNKARLIGGVLALAGAAISSMNNSALVKVLKSSVLLGQWNLTGITNPDALVMSLITASDVQLTQFSATDPVIFTVGDGQDVGEVLNLDIDLQWDTHNIVTT